MAEQYGGMEYRRVTAFTRYGYCEVFPGRGMPGATPYGVGQETTMQSGDLIAVNDFQGCTPESERIIGLVEQAGFVGKFYRHALGVLVS